MHKFPVISGNQCLRSGKAHSQPSSQLANTGLSSLAVSLFNVLAIPFGWASLKMLDVISGEWCNFWSNWYCCNDACHQDKLISRDLHKGKLYRLLGVLPGRRSILAAHDLLYGHIKASKQGKTQPKWRWCYIEKEHDRDSVLRDRSK